MRRGGLGELHKQFGPELVRRNLYWVNFKTHDENGDQQVFGNRNCQDSEKGYSEQDNPGGNKDDNRGQGNLPKVKPES